MKVLVTGAHGFLGSYIAERLVAGGDEVVALVSPWGDVENLGTARELAPIEVLRADLSQQGDLAWTLQGVDAVARLLDEGELRVGALHLLQLFHVVLCQGRR